MKSRSKLEILPPPPPVPGGELETELKLEEKPSFFQRFLRKEEEPEETKQEVSEESKAFNDLLAELDNEFESKEIGKSFEVKPIEKKLSKKELKELKKTELKEKKQLKIKGKKPKAEEFEDFADLDFALPEELEQKESELPDFIDTEQKELNQPIEILEAQDEIKSAIEKIKSKEIKPSLFQKLFVKKVQEQKKDEMLMPEFPETDDFSRIKNRISRARQALMNFDLEAAKKNYIESLRLYNNLKPEKQAKIYEDLRELYFERKSAEELRV